MGSENKGGESENSSSLRQILLCNIIPKFHRMTGEQSEDCSKEMKGQEFFVCFLLYLLMFWFCKDKDQFMHHERVLNLFMYHRLCFFFHLPTYFFKHTWQHNLSAFWWIIPFYYNFFFLNDLIRTLFCHHLVFSSR